MPEPTSMAELNERVMANTRIEGRFADTRTVMPCAFCGAADWLVFPVTAALNNYADIQKPTTCKECGRTARFVVTREGGSLVSELVQTAGPDAPEWMERKPRREAYGD